MSDIAIVGMAGLYPQAPDIDTFWSNILTSVDAITEAPEGWLGGGGIFDPESTAIERIYTRRGGFLGDLSRFDAKSFGTMPLSLSGAQPDQFLALKVATDALLDAGLTPGQFDGSRTGVILGLAVHANRANTNGIQQFWFQPQIAEMLAAFFPDVASERIDAAVTRLQAALPRITPDAIPGLIPNVLTGRIANRLDLMGPNYILDAACASSLITIDLAMNELRQGHADVMLAGGINTTTSPLVYAVFCAVNALDRDGLIRPFGREGSGTVLGEGAGIVVLKRLEDALAADDRIHAVIKGSGQSSDGTSTGLMAPRRAGAELAVRRAYERSGIDPATIGLVEAHGTGIPLGETIEVDALRAVFGGRRGPVPTVPIGSVKSMIGHCIPAAGSAAVIKTAMALQHRILPPTLVGEVNPETGLETTPFFVADEPRPWIGTPAHPRRAGVNAFGFGGINAHLILEEPPGGRTPDPTAAFLRPVAKREPEPRIFAFAGADAAEVVSALAAFAVPAAEALAATAAALWDAAEGQARLAIVAATPEELAKKIGAAQKTLAKPDVGSVQTRNGIYFEPHPIAGKIVFLFPGEMGQYRDMLKGAALAAPAIGDWIADISGLTEDRREVRLQDVIYPPESLISPETDADLEALMHRVDYGSEMVFAVDQALCDLLRSLGIAPDAMLGHSTGENAALVASGKLRLDRAGVVALIGEMNRVFGRVAAEGSVPSGVLLTVAALDRATLDRIRAGFPDIHFTMDNCPNQAILFGEGERIDALEAAVVAEGAVCTRLPISWGYHTAYVRPMAEGFRTLFERLEIGASPVELWSCATAAPFPEDPEDALETAIRQYVSPVRFTEAIRNLHDAGHRIFIECGPGSNLTAFVRDILGDRPHLAEAVDSKRRGGLAQLTHLVARLFAAGRSVAAGPLLAPAEGADAQARRALAAAHRAAPALPSELAAWRFDARAMAALRQDLFGMEGAPAPVPPAPPESAPPPAPAPAAKPVAAPVHLSAPLAVANLPAPPAASARIHVLDLARSLRLPFAFRAYLMQGSPSHAAMAVYLAAAEAAEAETLAAGRVERWQEWSLSRLAVKRAATEIMAETGGEALPAHRIEIRKTAEGAPYLADQGVPCPGISIAHVSAPPAVVTGVGMAAAPGVRVGIDYELPARIHDPESVLGTILGPAEAARLSPAADRETVTLLWTAKEAAAKALGQGLQGRPQAFDILTFDATSGAATLAHGPHRVSAHLRRVGAGVVAVAYQAA